MCLPKLPTAEGVAKGVPNAIAVFGLNTIKNDVAAKLLGSEHLPDGFSRRFWAMMSPAVLARFSAKNHSLTKQALAFSREIP
jgi:hypothetical protein